MTSILNAVAQFQLPYYLEKVRISYSTQYLLHFLVITLSSPPC